MRSAVVIGSDEAKRAKEAAKLHDALVKDAEKAIKKGDNKMGVKLLTEALAAFGKTSTVLRLAELQLTTSDYKSAASAARRVLQSMPEPEDKRRAEDILARCGSHAGGPVRRSSQPAIEDHLATVLSGSTRQAPSPEAAHSASPPPAPPPAPPQPLPAAAQSLVDELFGVAPAATPPPRSASCNPFGTDNVGASAPTSTPPSTAMVETRSDEDRRRYEEAQAAFS